VNEVQPGPAINAPPPASSGRFALDMLGAALGIILLTPVMAIIALVIKLDDHGPVFYAQSRAGKNGRVFRLLKFRSMIVGSDRYSLLTGPHDPRLTAVGRFLRRHKLDELPQLFNVLKGDMQLVGARPEVERYVHLFRSEYACLLRDRPGITDPATLAYAHEERILRSDGLEEQYITQVLPEKLRLSLDYQRRRAFTSDLRVLVQTMLGLPS
jgi:lipopolysaccharide/colanic/teichoic acid biosynthesis glycosyltransferase